jgi:hypothetical protein
MSPHATVSREIARLIAKMMKHDDGNLGHCTCAHGSLSEQWVAARAGNIAMAICGNYDVRPLEAHGEIVTVTVEEET